MAGAKRLTHVTNDSRPTAENLAAARELLESGHSYAACSVCQNPVRAADLCDECGNAWVCDYDAVYVNGKRICPGCHFQVKVMGSTDATPQGVVGRRFLSSVSGSG